MKVKIPNYPKGNGNRRVEVEVNKWDTYSADYTLALIILPVLLQLKETQHGVPGSFCDGVGSDYDRNFCFDFIDRDEIQNAGEEKWKETLDKMIWSFHQIVDDTWDSKYHHGSFEFDWAPIDITNPITGKITKAYEMVEKVGNTHWHDRVGQELHNERIKEGLELFGKYFQDLWD